MNSERSHQDLNRFKSEIWLPRSVPQVFEFFQHAGNLELLTPDWLNFKILTPLPISMREGALIDYSLRLYGIRFNWQTRISEWRPPHGFSDVQIRGPYRIWEHSHLFEEKDDGTLMRDQVNYQIHGWFLAPIINKLVVHRQITGIFEYRKKKILEMFG